MYRTQVIRSLTEWSLHGSAWNDLAARAGVHFPVHQAEPLASLANHFFDPQTFAAVLVWQGERLVAGIPLITRRRAVLAPTAKTLANDWSPRGCLLVEPQADMAACALAFLEGWRELGMLFAQLDWLPLDEPQVKALVSQWNEARVGCWIKPRFQVGRIDVPVDWDGFVGTWSRNRRKKQGQLERQLLRQGDVAFVDVDVSTRSAMAEAMERVYAIEHAGWKGQQGSSISSAPSARCFFDEWAAFHASQGWLRLHWLTVGGEPIAFDLGTIIHSVFTSYKISYLPEWAHYSPGQLLLRHQLEYLSRRGEAQWIDCLGVLDEATGRWTTGSFPIGKIVLSAGSWLGNHTVSWMASLSALKSRWR